MRKSGIVAVGLLSLAQAWGPDPASAVRQPERDGLAAREFRLSELNVSTTPVAPAALSGPSASAAAADLAAMGLAGRPAYFDERTARWSTLLPSAPLLPGRGNSLTWSALGHEARPERDALRALAWERFSGWVRDRQDSLRVDLAEFGEGRVTIDRSGDLVQIYVPRQVAGIAVRGSMITAVINHGNLILLGAQNWGDVEAPALPDFEAAEAGDVVARHVAPYTAPDFARKARLEFIPLAAGASPGDTPVGRGLEYRLAWVLNPRFEGSDADWEALVDANDGELIAFRDLTNYASTRQIQGGVYPLANDGQAPLGVQDGVLQTYPLPFADMTAGATAGVSDSGGNLAVCVDGTVTTHLSGPYVDIFDNCGAVNESTAGNLLDLGGTAGTTPHDCAIPAGHSTGDTASARSAFFEINKIAEMGRGHRPDNDWLRLPLPVEVNIALTCNATGGPGGLRFYRSGGGCTNTGEIAGVFDHEWGHGMDGADANPGISNPGEGIADTYASLRLNTSCVGRNFRLGIPCGGYGDPCIDPPGPEVACDGVRDIDYERRASGNPHTVDWANANCGSTGGSPCGGGVHCEGAIYAEAIWDLWHRDLTAGAFNMSVDTAREVASTLTFAGGQLVGSWYTCGPTGCPSGFCGCNADGGYLNYLAADDDNGNLVDGTPHASAIFAAFNRHQLACAAPVAIDSSCASGPSTAPTVSTTPFDRGATVTWTSVPNASTYRVYRTEGVSGCAFGKTLIGETSGLSWVDTDGLMNGRTYSYMVMAVGAGGSCVGAASACSTAVPAAGPNLAITTQPQLAILNGDNDAFLDNCEAARVFFGVDNIGTGTLTNVRVASASSPSHPAIDASISFPAAFAPSLAACGRDTGGFDFVATGLAQNDVVEFDIELTADEISPRTIPAHIEASFAETSFQMTASQSYNFEADTNGWTVEEGTFNRVGGGAANGTTFSERSSAGVSDICDRILSPLMLITPTSTLSLWNNYDIEPFSAGTWYDRANVSLLRPNGQATVVNPDSGRLYNAVPGGPGTYTGCNPEMGWAGTQATWNTSTWSATAFGGAVAANTPAQLRVTYSTDALLSQNGFWFDEVTVTNIGLAVADTQSNSCTDNVIFIDGFFSGNTAFWSNTVP